MTKLWQVLWSTRENIKDQRWEANHLKSNIVGVQIGAEMSLSALSSRKRKSDFTSYVWKSKKLKSLILSTVPFQLENAIIPWADM